MDAKQILPKGIRFCYGCMKKVRDDFEVCPHCGHVHGQEKNSMIHLTPGRILKSRYVVGETLGFGSFGVTYIAFDMLLEKVIAIKEYLPSEFATRKVDTQAILVSDNEKKINQFNEGKKKFLEEGRKLAQVSDIENVVHMDDCFEANGTAYITMEYLEGQTLADYLEEKGHLDEQETLDLMLPLLGALASVHEKGIIHRDISPENIFLTKNAKGETIAKLIDFGAAKYAVVAQSSKSLTVIVKQGYSPEEQYRSKGHQGRYTDVYAIGAVMYKMLTGVIPKDALIRRTKIENGKKDILEFPSKYNSNITRNVENAILNAMNVKVEDRTPSVDVFVSELISFEPVKLHGSSIRKIDFMRWPLWAKIGVPVATVAALAGLVFAIRLVLNPPSEVVHLPEGMTRVPEFVMGTFDEAQEKAEKVVLQVTTIGNEYTPDGKENIVLSQDIDYGMVVNENSLVQVVISTGTMEYTLPDVTGYDFDFAKSILESMGIEVFTEEIEANGYAKNVVVGQDIEPYEIITQGQTITLKVNTLENKNAGKDVNVKGMKLSDAIAQGNSIRVIEKQFTDQHDDQTIISSKVTDQGVIEVVLVLKPREFVMPNLNLASEDTSVTILRNMGIEPKLEHEYSDLYQEGNVYYQSVKSGEKIKSGDPVTIKVSRGGKPFTMPSLMGLSEKEAIEKIVELGLSYPDIEYDHSSDIKVGHVMSQSIDAGSDVRKGDKVRIVVCIEEKIELVVVPNVLGNNKDTAKSSLEKLKLKVTVNEIYSDTVKNGEVISQKPEAGTRKQPGLEVVITVSKGKDPSKVEVKPSNPTTPQVNPTEPPKNTSWSTWSTTKPSYVTEKDYEIETKLQYRYRTRETDTYPSSTYPEPGWTVYDHYSSWGAYSSWSSWSDTKYASSESVQVESKTQYRGITKEIYTGTTPPSGTEWVKDDSKTTSSVGNWSSWSETRPASATGREIETLQQYKVYNYTDYTTGGAPAGYELYDTQTNVSYGAWSSWELDYNSYGNSDTLEIERTQCYPYYAFRCANGHNDPYAQASGSHCSTCGVAISNPGNFVHLFTPDISWSQATTVYNKPAVMINGQYWWIWNGDGGFTGATTATRIRSKTITYLHKYRALSDWIDGTNANAAQTRTLYRYKDTTTTYTYYKEGNPTAWSDTYPSGDYIRVETKTVYRKRERSKQDTYYFEKWSSWSAYGDTPIQASQDKEIQTRVQYRWKEK